MRVWCERVKSCKFCDVEAEMLYMLVRKWRPNNVFEMAPNRGYSSHFILYALAANEHGMLHSFDIHNGSRRGMHTSLRPRWNLTVMDVREAVPTAAAGAQFMRSYDFIFIDALHTNAFSSWYTRALLSHAVECDTPVMIHDVVADADGGGRESLPVFQYMAFASALRHAFTMHPMHAPTPHARLSDPSGIDAARAAAGIQGPQKYFTNKESPTVFFTLETSTRGLKKSTRRPRRSSFASAVANQISEP